MNCNVKNLKQHPITGDYEEMEYGVTYPFGKLLRKHQLR